MAWLYAGRLACAVVAIMLFSAAISLAPEIRPYVVTFALIPRVLFQTSTISADASLIPLAALLTALLIRLASDREVSLKILIAVSAVTFAICLGKIAYIPLAALPVLISSTRANWSNRSNMLLITFSLVTVALWSAWFIYVRDKTFPISLNPSIQPAKQMTLVLHDPLRFLRALANSFHGEQGRRIIRGIVGGDIAGPGDFWQPFAEFPSIASYPLLLALCVLAFVGRRRATAKWKCLFFSAALALASFIMIMLGLYVQNTGLGLDFVDGFQGRYLIPIIILPVPFLPKYSVGDLQRLLSFGVLALLAGSALWSCNQMWIRYHNAVQSSDRNLRDSKLVNLRYPAIGRKAGYDRTMLSPQKLQ